MASEWRGGHVHKGFVEERLWNHYSLGSTWRGPVPRPGIGHESGESGERTTESDENESCVMGAVVVDLGCAETSSDRRRCCPYARRKALGWVDSRE